jgi:hypothetical protein
MYPNVAENSGCVIMQLAPTFIALHNELDTFRSAQHGESNITRAAT